MMMSAWTSLNHQKILSIGWDVAPFIIVEIQLFWGLIWPQILIGSSKIVELRSNLKPWSIPLNWDLSPKLETREAKTPPLVPGVSNEKGQTVSKLEIGIEMGFYFILGTVGGGWREVDMRFVMGVFNFNFVDLQSTKWPVLLDNTWRRITRECWPPILPDLARIFSYVEIQYILVSVEPTL